MLGLLLTYCFSSLLTPLPFLPNVDTIVCRFLMLDLKELKDSCTGNGVTHCFVCKQWLAFGRETCSYCEKVVSHYIVVLHLCTLFFTHLLCYLHFYSTHSSLTKATNSVHAACTHFTNYLQKYPEK